jgi:hypothetical protein
MKTVTKSAPGPISAHIRGVWSDVGIFFLQAVRNPFVSLNLVFTLVLAFGAMEKFGHTNSSDITYFTDMAFLDSLPVVGAASLGLGTPVVPGRLLADETTCSGYENDVHMGNPCFDGKLKMGRSGIFGNGFLGLEQNSFNVPHFIWVATWFTAPISLFLVANDSWTVFHQWMWWSLYMFIFVWDVIGLLLMLMWHQSPMYNKLMAFVYFSFSGLLMLSVRETWRVLMRNGQEGAPMSSERPASLSSVIHPFMKNVQLGVTQDPAKGVYEKVENVEVDVKAPNDNIPSVISHTFTRTVLLLSEFFFLAPVIVSTAYVMSQDRVIPFDIQSRKWQVSLLFGVVVLLEKARKTRLSYVTDTVLVLASGIAILGVVFLAVPEIIWVCVNLPTRPAMAIMYTCFAIVLVVALVNIIVNMYYITFVGKDSHALDEYRDSSAPVMGVTASKTGHTVYTRAVFVMYYFNVVSLMIVKFLLMMIIVLGFAQNRLGT